MVKVHVEHCSSWGYGERFDQLKRKIRGVVLDAEITSSTGRRGAFEISINGELAFSKLGSPALCGLITRMPNFDEVVDAVKEAAGKQ